MITIRFLDVGVVFGQERETIYSTIMMFDLFLERGKSVLPNQAQLIICVLNFMACKFFEVYIHGIDDYMLITENQYSKEEFLSLEGRLLTIIDWVIPKPITWESILW